MKTRAITAFFFAASMLASFFLGSAFFTFFYWLLSGACLLEFYRLVKSEHIQPLTTIGFFLGLMTFLLGIAAVKGEFDPANLLLLVPIVLAIYIHELYRKSPQPFNNIAYTIFGPIYVVLPFCFFYGLSFLSGEYNYQLSLGTLLLIWANDSGAYFFGIKLGKHRLFERHSPKKSWEGFVGGLLVALLGGGILSQFFQAVNPTNWLIVALICSVAGTYGDLSESMLKRSIGTKDSGGLLPGHGGLLDRFDSLFFAAPAVYLYLTFAKLL